MLFLKDCIALNETLSHDAIDVISEIAPRIARHLGEKYKSVLGKGSYGVAFELDSGRVMKITTNTQEALQAQKQRNKSFKHIVSAYDVRAIEHNSNEDRYDGLYVITMDRVHALNDMQQSIWNEFYSDLFDLSFIDDDVIRREMLAYSDGEESKFIDLIIDQRNSIVAELKKAQVDMLEAHEENVGISDAGVIKIFDTAPYWTILKKLKMKPVNIEKGL